MSLKSKMAAYIRRALDIRDPATWPVEASYSGERVSEQSALALSAVWACVNLLSGTISSLPVMVYRTDAAGVRTVAKDHSLYRLLHDSPNADQTAVDFWDFEFASQELRGNSYARIVRERGRIVALEPVAPDLVTVIRLKNGYLEYRWTENGKQFVETDRTMLHIRGFGGSPLGGISTLQMARNTFGLATAIDKSASSMFANGMRPSGVLTLPGVLKPDQRDEIELGLQTKFMGAMNSGRPMVLEGGTKWEQLTIDPEDAQMLESRAFSIEEICRFFGVPPVMVGHTSKTTSWPTGVEQQALLFQKFTLRRRLKRAEQALEKQLLTPEDRAGGISIEWNLEGLLRGDSAARSTFYREMTNIGAMTINEVRALENLPPVTGGDVPRMQMQNVPITEAGKDLIGHNGGPSIEE
jgi:HK97 family phage portal protein